jgi:hypothetical protein
MRIQPPISDVDLSSILPWQYDTSVNMQALIARYQEWLNENIIGMARVYNDQVLNLLNANDLGVTVWSRILAYNPRKYINPQPGLEYFGFDGNDVGFDQASFTLDGSSALVAYLSVDELRLMLALRYFSFMWDGTISTLNKFLAIAFKQYGRIYCVDNLDMRIITFYHYFNPWKNGFRLLFNPDYANDYWPRPATVGIGFVDRSFERFGFDGNDLGFDQAPFLDIKE